MASTSETGHAINAANFDDLISFGISFKEKYAPSTEELQVKQLMAQSQAVKLLMDADKNLTRAFNKATNSRMVKFRPLQSLSTRMVNSLAATKASGETKKDARVIHRKIQGRRAPGNAIVAHEAAPVAENATPPGQKQISASQQSYDSQASNFDKLLVLLQAEEHYKPNETDLQIAPNLAYLEQLQKENKAVGQAFSDYTNGQIARNTALYAPEVGLVDTAFAVKKYILSVFNASSPEYKKVNAINFKTFKL